MPIIDNTLLKFLRKLIELYKVAGISIGIKVSIAIVIHSNSVHCISLPVFGV